jgi:two-component system, OmpR family, response regulator
MPNVTPTPSAEALQPPRVLIVDDDAAIRELVRRYFERSGFVVSDAGDATQARAALDREQIDLVLLDIGLPGEDGLTLTRYLREHWHGAVIIISGRGDPIERIIGLEVGADDYLAKPFDLRELLARARSVLRRLQAPAAATAREPAQPRSYAFAGMRIEPDARRLIGHDGDEIALTTGEFDLLIILVEQANRALSREHLMQRLHGREAGPFDRAIDVQIGRLRQKIERDPSQPDLIRSVRGVGYLFSCPVQRR